MCAATGSGSRFSYNDYNYDNDNSNVRSHIAQKKLTSTDPASWQKITKNFKGVGNESEHDLQSKGA